MPHISPISSALAAAIIKERLAHGEHVEIPSLGVTQGGTRMDTETEPLKPCPFCGGQARPDKLLRDGHEPNDLDAWAHFYRCRSCACEGGWAKSEHNARRRWNRRVPDPEMELRVSAFAGQLQAWGADEAARELLKEVIGGTVNAPDYYALQAENARLRTAADAMRSALTECAEALEAQVEDVYRWRLDSSSKKKDRGRDMQPVERARAAAALLEGE